MTVANATNMNNLGCPTLFEHRDGRFPLTLTIGGMSEAAISHGRPVRHMCVR
jgi:hypothetical protein